MYFKKLELQGFKSFADKTVIQFEPGVTAIVGPNGCGKSNVSDSIRWVLGEQSAKSLRGSSMEDVIFSGSSTKEPVNFAEVSLTLSNENRILAIDYEEVTISRRLYRSGESEYLLNKNVVRLKDIHELLLGTGIGTESYSIIEQGKMDVILNSKPEDRRVIFEEAAGITKFKSKKKEALRKLEQTDQNLLRINDIIAEVKRQIGSIERQAKKAESYKIEFEKLKGLELSVASREFFTFESQRRDKEAGLEALKSEEESAHARVEEIEGRWGAGRAELDAIDETLRESREKELSMAGEIRQNQDRILLNRERVGELLGRREHLAGQMRETEKRVDEFRAEFAALDAKLEDARREEAEGASFLATIENEFASLDRAAQDHTTEEEGIEVSIDACAERRARANAELARIQAQLHSLDSRLKRIKHDEESLLREIRSIDESLSDPLFDAAGPQKDTIAARIQSKVSEFKERLTGFIKAFIQKQSYDGTEEAASLDAEIRQFADEIVKIQGRMTFQESQTQHLRDSRRKLEDRLASAQNETREIEAEQVSLKERERSEEASVALIADEEKAAQGRLASVKESSRAKFQDRESFLVRLAETRSRHAHSASVREKIEKDKTWILDSLKSQEALVKSYADEGGQAIAKKDTLEAESRSLEEGLSDLAARRDEVLRASETIRHQREEIAARIAQLDAERQERQTFLQEAKEKVHAYQMESAEIRFSIDRLKERIYNAYQVDLAIQEQMSHDQAAALDAVEGDTADLEATRAEIARLKDKLQKMGPVNLAAMDEHDEMKQRFDFLSQQQADLVQAKDDLHKAILKINRTTKELFVETFSRVQKYFTEYYKLLFGGGTAELVLMDADDVLETGIEIVARPPGKKLQNISLLSGGEKALTAVALLFALFKVKPSPFCILDEIDAPLDETNVERFCGVLKEFIVGSQFILITHNKRTMNLADAMYGVTMAQTGVSRIVSVRFSEKKDEKKELTAA